MEHLRGLWPMIGYCGHLGRRCLDRQLRQYGITPVQCQVVLYLKEAQQEVTQQDLGQLLRLKAPTVNGIVDRMEEKGLLTRTTSRTDARCRILRLTDHGREMWETFHRLARQAEQRNLSVLSEEEQQSLRDMMIRLIEHLENEANRR